MFALTIPRTPLLQAQFARLFFYPTVKYNKDPYTSIQHIELLKERGLIINNEERAFRYLENISYFRLSGYMFHYQAKDGTHRFNGGITFEQIIDEYNFDKKLKLLILEYIERIEVALRAKMSNKYSISNGFYWYRDSNLFQDQNIYLQINNHIAESFRVPSDIFLRRFKSKYTGESMPPSNMAIETLTLGKISRLFAGLKNSEDKQAISNEFNLTGNILASWFVYLTNIRNICAHHSRLWNKSLTADRPLIPNRKRFKFNGDLPEKFNSSVYGVLAIIDRLLEPINTTNKFIEKFHILLDKYPNIDVKYMGFPENWTEEPAWK